MLTKEDLARYAPRVLPALMGEYRGLELAFSPGATGGTTSLEMLNVLAQFPKARTTWKTPGGLHLRAEAVRRAFLDRLEHLGDTERVKSPWEGLASREYAAKVASGLRAAGPRSSRPAPDPWRYEMGGRASDCTTHLCAVDRKRNMVARNTAVSPGARAWWCPAHPAPERMIWFDPEPVRQLRRRGPRPLVNMVPALGFKRAAYLAAGARAAGRSCRRFPSDLEHGRSRRQPQEAINAPATEGGDLCWTTAWAEAS
jgi:hypothetical protein